MKRRNRENGHNVEEWKGRNKCGQLQLKKERHYQKYILHYILIFEIKYHNRIGSIPLFETL